MMDDPMIAYPLALVWAPAVVVGSVWARRSLVYGIVTMVVAGPFLLAAWMIAWMGMGFLEWLVMSILLLVCKVFGIEPPGVDGGTLMGIAILGAHILTLGAWILYLKSVREQQRGAAQWAAGMSNPPPKPRSNPFMRRMR